jgi:hypothetical protein
VQALSLAVVGAQYPNKTGPDRRFEITLCSPGDPVQLVPEPKNKHDPRAVQVMSERGVVMGYITAERAPLVRQLLSRHDVRAIFQEQTPWGAVIRLAIDGASLALPPLRPTANQEQDWYPDDIYPDE